jgi:hypothetical protein
MIELVSGLGGPFGRQAGAVRPCRPVVALIYRYVGRSPHHLMARTDLPVRVLPLTTITSSCALQSPHWLLSSSETR